MSIPIVISPVVVRVGHPVDMIITPVGDVPIGVVVGDRLLLPIGINPMHPPAVAVRVACDKGMFDRFGAAYRGDHQGCTRNSENVTQLTGSVKTSHVSPFFADSHIRQIFPPQLKNDARRGQFRQWMAAHKWPNSPIVCCVSGPYRLQPRRPAKLPMLPGPRMAPIRPWGPALKCRAGESRDCSLPGEVPKAHNLSGLAGGAPPAPSRPMAGRPSRTDNSPRVRAAALTFLIFRPGRAA